MICQALINEQKFTKDCLALMLVLVNVDAALMKYMVWCALKTHYAEYFKNLQKFWRKHHFFLFVNRQISTVKMRHPLPSPSNNKNINNNNNNELVFDLVVKYNIFFERL